MRLRRNWLHLEIDNYTDDGINQHRLRPEWNAFFHNSNPDPGPLIQELRSRCQKARGEGVALSFPSNLIKFITAGHLAACGGEVSFVFLSGAPEYCVNSFLAREAESGRGLSERHWYGNNENLYCALASLWLRGRTIDAFDTGGGRKPFESLCAEVEKLCANPLISP
jgi:hypothetical protein